MATHTTPELQGDERKRWFDTEEPPWLSVCRDALYRVWALPKKISSVWLTFSDREIKDSVPIRFSGYRYTTSPTGQAGAGLDFGLGDWLQKRWPILMDGKIHKLYVRLEYVE